MNDDSILGNTLGQLGQFAKQSAKQIVKIPGEMAETAGKQVGATSDVAEAKEDENKKVGKSGFKTDEERSDMSKDGADTISSDKSATSAEASAAKPEEQIKLRELRKQLHDQYYQTLTNPQKPEERPAEKVEKEKKMEALALEEKDKKKPPPLAVVREQNKAEMFRGASG